MDETEIAEKVVASLIDENGRYRDGTWKLHSEVPLVIDGQTYPIDLVAQRDPAATPEKHYLGGPPRATMQPGSIHVYEFKRSLTADLVDQTWRSKAYADESWAVVREPESQSAIHQHRVQTLRRYGLGLIYVRPLGLSFMLLPTVRSRTMEDLAEALCDAQVGGLPAGSAGGQRIKRDEWERVRAFIRARPGLTAKDLEREGLLSKTERVKFSTLAWNGKVRGVKAHKGFPARFYADE